MRYFLTEVGRYWHSLKHDNVCSDVYITAIYRLGGSGMCGCMAAARVVWVAKV